MYNDTLLQENAHDLIELPINLTDATILGTENHLMKMDLVTSRYQIRFDNETLKINSFKSCMEDRECSSYFTDSNAKLLMSIFTVLFDDYSSLSVTDRASNLETFQYM